MHMQSPQRRQNAERDRGSNREKRSEDQHRQIYLHLIKPGHIRRNQRKQQPHTCKSQRHSRHAA